MTLDVISSLEDAKKFYKSNGFVKVKLIPEKKITRLRESLADLIKTSYRKHISPELLKLSDYEILNDIFIKLEKNNHEYVSKLYNSIRMSSTFLDVANDENLRKWVNLFLGNDPDENLFLNSTSIRMDPPKLSDFSYGWHVDGLINVRNSDFVQSWTPLVNVTPNIGGLEIILNSHIKPVESEYSKYIRETMENKIGLIDNMSGTGDKILFSPPYSTKIISPDFTEACLTADAGETILFSDQLMHRSGLNVTEDKVRYVVTSFFHDGTIQESDWF
jgi:hypothetical protein